MNGFAKMVKFYLNALQFDACYIFRLRDKSLHCTALVSDVNFNCDDSYLVLEATDFYVHLFLHVVSVARLSQGLQSKPTLETCLTKFCMLYFLHGHKSQKSGQQFK